MIALIDGDSLLYKVGFALEDNIDWDCDDNYEYYSNLPKQKESIIEYLEAITKATGSDSYELWLTGSNNFREKNPLGYKEHRHKLRKPTDFNELKLWLSKNPRCYIAEGMEADDIVVYLKDSNYDKYMSCAMDKDVIYQTEGTHYNYDKGTYITVTKEEAIWFSYYQTLVGDVTDGYKGCPSIGDTRARKLIGDVYDEPTLWKIVVDTYISKGLTEEDAINTMRLACMKQYNGKEIVLWEPNFTSN